MVESLHLVELAAQRLREESADAPETALLPESGASRSKGPGESVPPATRIEIETLEAAGMIASSERRDRIAEEFRIVAQQVLAGIETTEGAKALRNLVMVTSAVPREGKSFTALNLAAHLALGGKRPVVLIDADTGPGSMSKSLGLEKEMGLLDLAGALPRANDAPWVRSRIDSLSILPIGGGTDAAGRALISSHYPIAQVIASLSRRFAETLFLVDAPSCLSSSDPAAIAATAGQILLVVEAERTRRAQIEAGLDLIDACQNIKLMLNKVRMKTSETFGAYS